MTKYIRSHEKYMMNQLSDESISEGLLIYHRRQVSILQHERLVHLLVMMLVSILFVIIFVYTMLQFSIGAAILAFILGVLDVFYIKHYYLLENTVQRWYLIENSLEKQLTQLGVNTLIDIEKDSYHE